MKNMGPKSSEWLASVGVVETYQRVKAAYPDKVTLNLLWELQATQDERKKR